MKRISLFLLLLCSVSLNIVAMTDDDGEEVELTTEKTREEPLGPGYPRSPVEPPTATINDHTFHITCAHPDYVLQLVDMDDNTVVYQTAMPAAISTATLPSVFTGQYRIQLIWGMWCFYGFVEL